MIIKELKEVLILGTKFKIKWKKKKYGGSFSFTKEEMVIGTKDPEETFNILTHEISEAIHCAANTRYTDYGTAQDYKFFQTHKEFQLHIIILTDILKQFIG